MINSMDTFYDLPYCGVCALPKNTRYGASCEHRMANQEKFTDRIRTALGFHHVQELTNLMACDVYRIVGEALCQADLFQQ